MATRALETLGSHQFALLPRRMFKLRTARYMAPEQFGSDNRVSSASKESDVYSLAMMSFTVCSSSHGKQSDT